MKYISRIILLHLIIIFTFLSQSKGQGGPYPGSKLNPEVNCIITGRVIDSLSNEFIEFANIILFSAKDSQMVSGLLTDEKGYFTITKLKPGEYFLKASFLGYSEKTIRNIILTPKEQIKDMGNILLRVSSTELQGATITAEKKEVEFHLDKKVVNVEKNIMSQGGSAVDVLQNVPSVTVDYDGNVSLRGSGNVNILIDGRPSGLTGLKLEQIPASSIESIEVITNPSAKFNPEGMAGILNIKLKKKRDKGLNGMISANAGTGDKYNGSVNLNYNFGKVNLFGSIDGRIDNRTGKGNSDRTTNIDDAISYQHQEMESGRERRGVNYKLGADVIFNPRNSLTLTWMMNNQEGTHSDHDKSWKYDSYYSLSNYYLAGTDEDDREKSHDFSLNYRKTFERKGEEFTVDAILSLENESESENMDYTYFGTDFIQDSTLKYLNNIDINGYEGEVQVNYVYPFSELFTLETGYQGIFRGSDDKMDYFTPDPLTGNLTLDYMLSNSFAYDENIHGVYMIGSAEYKSFSFQPGVRLEQAFNAANQKTQDIKNEQSYFSIFPSIHVSKKLKNDQDMQVSYSLRINRPEVDFLNPFVDYSNPDMRRFGNPDLKPEYIHSTELSYIKYFKKSSVTSTVFYRQINDAIKRVVTVDTSGIYNYTFDNVSSGKSYGLEFIGDLQLARWWKMSANFSYFRTEIKDDNEASGYNNDNMSWNSRISSSFTLPKSFFVQLNGTYRGPMVTPQGEMDEMFMTDIAIRKDLLQSKMNLTFRLSDIFNTAQFNITAKGDGFTADMHRKRESRVAMLGLTWKINEGIKQKARSPMENGQMNGEEGF